MRLPEVRVLIQVGLVDNIIPIEDRPGPVAGQGHGDLLRDPGPDQVADRRPPEVMGLEPRGCSGIEPARRGAGLGSAGKWERGATLRQGLNVNGTCWMLPMMFPVPA